MAICWLLHVRRRMPKQISINHRQFLCFFSSVFCSFPTQAEPKIIYCSSPKCSVQNEMCVRCVPFCQHSFWGLSTNSTCDAHQIQFENWQKKQRETIGLQMRFTFRHFRSRSWAEKWTTRTPNKPHLMAPALSPKWKMRYNHREVRRCHCEITLLIFLRGHWKCKFMWCISGAMHIDSSLRSDHELCYFYLFSVVTRIRSNEWKKKKYERQFAWLISNIACNRRWMRFRVVLTAAALARPQKTRFFVFVLLPFSRI